MDIAEAALKYAVKNAYEHNGAPNLGAVIGKIKALFPETDIKETAAAAKEAVEKVGKMGKKEIETLFMNYEKEGFELKPREEEKGLPELEWAKNEPVVTRFAPNPNAPFHLGNSRAAILSAEYAKKYKGKFVLRLDDTDPKLKLSIDNAEQVFVEDLKWLGYAPDEIFFASDRLGIYFNYMKELAEKGALYSCNCNSEEWSKNTAKKIACPCREQPKEATMKALLEMKEHTMKEGQAVLRMRTDLQHPDPSVRDWWIARVVDNPTHPRVKGWHLWPSYNFASAIDDHDLGTTFIIRGQEHSQNKVKQEYLYKYMGWTYPHISHIGRVKLEGAVLSKSQINKGIKEGLYTGYDDPRLGTIRALRRRGFRAETIVETIQELGLKSSDTTVQWKSLAAKNRKYLENAP